MEVEVSHVSVESHDLLLWQNIHSVVQHSLHVFHSLASIFSLVYTLKRDLQIQAN